MKLPFVRAVGLYYAVQNPNNHVGETGMNVSEQVDVPHKCAVPRTCFQIVQREPFYSRFSSKNSLHDCLQSFNMFRHCAFLLLNVTSVKVSQLGAYHFRRPLELLVGRLKMILEASRASRRMLTAAYGTCERKAFVDQVRSQVLTNAN